jgi:hypothetical protein
MLPIPATRVFALVAGTGRVIEVRLLVRDGDAGN